MCVCVCVCVCVCMHTVHREYFGNPTKTSLPPAPASALHCHRGHLELRRLHVFEWALSSSLPRAYIHSARLFCSCCAHDLLVERRQSASVRRSVHSDVDAGTCARRGVCERGRVRVCAQKGFRERAATRSQKSRNQPQPGCHALDTRYMNSTASKEGPGRDLLHKVQGPPVRTLRST